jgi:hypothetical protein
MSIIWQYRRLFPAKWMFWTCNVMLILMTLYGLYGFFGAIFMCIPVSSQWTQEQGTCMSLAVYYYLTSIVNISADVVIFLLPAHPIIKLQISRSQKIALLLAFTVGIL